MKVVNMGEEYTLYGDSLHTYDRLPPQTYIVRFASMRGFYLEKYVNMEIPETKIYGVHQSKVEKVLSAFGEFNRNLGVILSGDKGIGKSLFAKLLSIEAVKRGLPLIVVDTFVPGIASYIESIEQEVMVLFDEFDKTFGEVKAEDGKASPQANLLSLFDGVSGGKKLFVITCNNMWKLNEYLINRPGRFHYHFRFEYPSPTEVREYLEDKLPKKQYGEIDAVVMFSQKVNLNYDCLRAIAFEIGRGEDFKTAIADLNILNTETQQYSITVLFRNGRKLVRRKENLDLFGAGLANISVYNELGGYEGELHFDREKLMFDQQTYTYYIPSDGFRLEWADEDDEETKRLIDAGVDKVIITRCAAPSLRYAI